MAVSVHSTYPANGASSFDIHSYIQVVLATAIDESSVAGGSIFIEGPARDIQNGPFNPVNYVGSSLDDVFTDPSYGGITKVSYEFDAVDTDGVTPVSTVDTAGSGTYYSRVTLYPDKPFSPLTEYTAYIVGTGTGATNFGVAARTVYNPVADPTNVGNGTVYPVGGHTSSGTHTFEVQITGSGEVSEANYKWRKNSAPYSGSIRTHSFQKLLGDGISISFSPSGTFQVGDQFTFIAKEPEYLSSINSFSFVTGEEGTRIIVGTASSLLSIAAPVLPSDPTPGLSFVRTFPESPNCDISADRTSFSFYFNKTLNTSASTEGIEIFISAPDGDSSVRDSTHYYATSYEISGSQLTVHL